MLSRLLSAAALLVSILAASPVQAQPTLEVSGTPTPAAQAPVIVETPDTALARDAREYAKRYDVSPDDAVRRLRAQQDSVAFTDRLAEIYAPRLAGIAIAHQPDFAIIILLTGSVPVPDTQIFAGGMNVPVRFRIGAPATRAQIDAVMASRQELRTAFPIARGMGLDMRSGELVVMVMPRDAASIGEAALTEQLLAFFGVPVRIRTMPHSDANMMLAGGSRISGLDPALGKRFACTAGFVVSDGVRTGVATAAHCPDELSYANPGGERIALAFAGQWGARFQDVQIGVSPDPLQPLFYAEKDDDAARPLTGSRSRLSTRAGEFVCHRGEGSGYSCAEVDLVDYAPPGDLCGGPCDAVWITVRGPDCHSGDSGGPVFSGTIAYGIVKGQVHASDGGCSAYFYMSTEFLPTGWSLVTR